MNCISVLLYVAIAAVNAHFTLDAPASRGFDDDKESTAPCGGFNSVNSNRTLLALNGGRYQINSHHASALVSVVLSSDGTTFGTNAVQQYTLTGLGTFCAQLGNLTGYATGQNATLQIIYKSPSESSNLYQCADVQLTDQSVTPIVCTNGTGIAASNLKIGSIALSGSSATSSSAVATGTTATSTAKVSGADALSWRSPAVLLVTSFAVLEASHLVL